MKMLDICNIRSVELEISSFCSARCPLCPRNVFGYPYENGFTPRNLTLEEVKTILSSDFVRQLDHIKLEGNLGDFNMNPEAEDIVDYFISCNSSIKIEICTNGAARNKDFWKSLSHPSVEISFALDGLADTHHLYRKDTRWETVISNASAFIDRGGRAVWKMIKFDHNQHQIEACKKMSEELGFSDFRLIDHGRDCGPVFDRDGKLEYVLGNWKGKINLDEIMQTMLHGDILEEDITPISPGKITCLAQQLRQIYVSANGDVFPCCFMGFNPRSFGRGTWHQPINSQINQLQRENNALKYPLQHCIEWFDSILEHWASSKRLLVCDFHCANSDKIL